MLRNKRLVNKWAKVLSEDVGAKIESNQKKAVLAQLLENTVKNSKGSDKSSFLREAVTTTDNIENYETMLVSLQRQTIPQLVAFDIMGVQPMTSPVQLVYAKRFKYTDKNGAELGWGYPNDPAHSGNSDSTVTVTNGLYDPFALDGTGNPETAGTIYSTLDGESVGSAGNDYKDVSLAIEKVSVTVGTRKLRTQMTEELIEDMFNQFGADVEADLLTATANEILREKNVEALQLVNSVAVTGAQNTAVAGVFDLSGDGDGRWQGEKFKTLSFQVLKEANAIYQSTFVGRGNVIICSANVAAALSNSKVLDYDSSNNHFDANIESTTFVGTMNGGQIKVFIDPYASSDYITIGYKSNTDNTQAGLFYCPYVPIQMKGIETDATGQPKALFRTRYAYCANPYSNVDRTPLVTNINDVGTNAYYRKFKITGI